MSALPLIAAEHCTVVAAALWANCRREQMQQKPCRCLFRVLAMLM
jgi:hypothetical protein